MPFILIVIGAILIIAAFNGTHTDLARHLEQDIPGFFKWLIAIVAIAALGFVPGLRTPSRYLLALVLMVIFLVNYQRIIDGFKNFANTGTQTAQTAASAETAALTAGAQQTQAAQAAEVKAAQSTTGQPAPSSAVSSIASNLMSPAMLGVMLG